ncbi:MAG TPA: efflux RND transporter permease subunit, partial [Planctomycetota bacterium]|nr:efflux RND transporter permease subunit [Planctomycetota bacterium]
MKGVIAWFTRNGVAANLLAIVIVAGGLLTLPGIKEEVFPELEADTIAITVPFPGATPAEVEEAICMRIEEAVDGLADVKRIRSEAREGVGSVFVEMLENANRSRLVDEVRSRVDGIDTFPEEAEEPQVQELVIRRQVVNVAVSGDADEKSLRSIAEQVRDEIAALPGISYVTLGNARPYEISIEVSEDTLRRYGLTFDQIAAEIRQSSLDLPGGSVETRGGEILLRTKGQSYRGEDFERIAVLTRADGTRLELGDIARVNDGFEDTDQYTVFDGKPAILVRVFRVGEQGALDIASQVNAWLESARHRYPDGISLTIWQDDSRILESRLDLMVRNGRMGLILVLVTLALFLRPALALWVAFGIPVAFLGAIWLMPALGSSINLMSLFAFIVVLGIVVDDAIVVAENIYTRVRRGESGVDAAAKGAKEVALPVTFSVLTTVAAFVPLLIVPGRYGEVMRMIPLIVIPTLLFSLGESLFILPRHLSHLRPEEPASRKRGPLAFFARIQNGIARGLEIVAARYYRAILERALRWRYLSLAIAISILALTFGWVGSGRLPFTFFPPVDADNVVVFVTMPQGTPVELTEDAVRIVEEAAVELRAELAQEQGGDVFRHIVSSIGGQPFREAQNQNQGQSTSFSGSHLAELNIELLPSEERSISSESVANRLRAKVGSLPGSEDVDFDYSIFASG